MRPRWAAADQTLVLLPYPPDAVANIQMGMEKWGRVSLEAKSRNTVRKGNERRTTDSLHQKGSSPSDNHNHNLSFFELDLFLSPPLLQVQSS